MNSELGFHGFRRFTQIITFLGRWLYEEGSTPSGLVSVCDSYSTGFTRGYSNATPSGLRMKKITDPDYKQKTILTINSKHKTIPKGLNYNTHKTQTNYSITTGKKLIPQGLNYNSHGCNPWTKIKKDGNPQGLNINQEETNEKYIYSINNISSLHQLR